MNIQPYSVTFRSERVAALGGQEICYADRDGSGTFEPSKDTTVFVADSSGGGLVNYSELRDALTTLGGAASGQQLAKALGKEDARIELAEAPEGLAHPLVNGRFTLQPDGIRADYDVGASLPIIPPADGNVATLDVNRDGVSEPQHDSMLMLHAYQGGREYTGMCSYEGLRQVVQAAGGEVKESDFTARLAPLAPFATGASSVWLQESPEQFDVHGARRTLRTDGEGRLFLDYDLR